MNRGAQAPLMLLGRYRTQRETGDRMIGWGFILRSRVSAIGYRVRVFGYRYWSRDCDPNLCLFPYLKPRPETRKFGVS